MLRTAAAFILFCRREGGKEQDRLFREETREKWKGGGGKLGGQLDSNLKCEWYYSQLLIVR